MNLSSLSISSAGAASTETKPLTLREGQMIHGKIAQLFPGQMAQVQVGNQRLYAKLEVPMQAGDQYFFKVNGTEPELQLQVISGPMRSGEGQSAQLSQLMESLDLPKTQEMKDMLTAIIRQKIPVTKENLLEAVTLLQSAPRGMKAIAVETLGKMAESRLPITPSVFRSLLQAQSGTISQQLTTLQTAIQKEPNLSPALREQLVTTMQALSTPAGQAVGRELLGSALSQLLDPQTDRTERFAALQLLKSADILPARTSLANLPQVLAELVTNTADAKTAANAASSQTAAANAVLTQLSQLTQAAAANQQTVSAIMQNITRQLANTSLPESVKHTLQTVLNQLTQQPVTEAAKAAVIEQFSRVFTEAGAAAAPSALASVQNIQTAISQLSQTPAADLQRIEAIEQHLARHLQNNSALPEPVKQALQNSMSPFTQQPLTETAKTAAVEQLSHALLQQAGRQDVSREVQQALQSLFIPSDKSEEAMRSLYRAAESSANNHIRQILQAAETQVSQTMNGPVMKEAIQHIVSTLGLNYEAVLNDKDPDLSNIAHTLKPQLLAILQDPSLSPPLRDAAETMVLRMNGTVIQSGDTGLQHQLIMQLPLEMFGKKIDATLQWNGRMKENGQIDPSFARILFYLELESLSTTLVDMHVQNKVVNLTIFNGISSLKTTGMPFQVQLKEGLEKAGYKLSGISFKPFTEQQQISEKAASAPHFDEGGVDYRI
ncbi:hypothetical protein SporoP37_14515 [Sporosarcina sp. P37]|uniref:hypothetical protein n=1 Tax=unclassified Sporosarcina TaxID=2647733 RepID=UPI000A17F591|nr:MULTISPECIES: hypothetical protein [unclassified Sporosarcina]ARK25752.1 hypothetical protein SporoP37_14515 [Sporosarcina sp. P37]PID19224.1 hypothetical protein CSV62_04570 [Sporosarcina sp. P35]